MVKNIVVVQDYAFISGGAAKVAIRSAIGLSEAGYEVTYFSAVGPVCEELIHSKVKVYCLNIKNINTAKRAIAALYGIWNQNAYREMKQLLHNMDTNTTVIHFHGWSKALSCSVLKAAQDLGFKVVVTLHDYFIVCPNGGFYDYKSGCICKRAGMSISCICHNCDKRRFTHKIWRVVRQIIQDKYVKNNENINYISISELNERVVKEQVRSNRFYRIKNPIDLFEHPKSDRVNSNIYLYVGRLSEEKGVELFCKAVEQVVSRGNDIRAIVIGAGNLLDTLNSQYSEIIEFVGWQPAEKVEEYMKKARCLVLPSKWYEGAPLTILEALSSGLPCIVSDCTSATEVVIDGFNGFVFETNNIESLIRSIERSLDSSCMKREVDNIQNNMTFISYSLRAHLENLVKVYNSICENI